MAMDYRTRILYGRNPALSRQLVVVAIGLLALSSTVYYTDVNTWWPDPVAVTGGLFVVAVAATAAYVNDAIPVSWLLGFAVILPAFVFYPPRGPTFAVTLATVPIAVATAAAVAVALGTIGFVLGWWLRRRRDRGSEREYEPSAAVLPRLFIGRDRHTSGRWVAGATGEFAVVFLGTWFGVLPFGFGMGGPAGIAALIVVMAVPATVVAIRNRGLLVSWLLAVAPLFGVFLALQLGATLSPAPANPPVYALGVSLLFGIPVGTVGFLVGVISHRLHRRVRSPSRPESSPE